MFTRLWVLLLIAESNQLKPLSKVYSAILLKITHYSYSGMDALIYSFFKLNLLSFFCCVWRERSFFRFVSLKEGLCPLLKFHFWECVVNTILRIASPHKVFLNVVMSFFECFDWRVCTKESWSFAFYKAFLCFRWVTRCKECALECLRWFEVRPHIENWLLVESLALVYCDV